MIKDNIIEGNICEIINQISNNNKIHYQNSGIKSFDDVLNGFMPGEIVTLLGESGSGRTGCVIRMTDYLAADNAIPILYFCCNYSAETFVCRLLSFRYDLEYKPTMKELTAINQSGINKSIDELSHAPVYISSASHFSIDMIEEKCRTYIQQKQVKVVFIPMLYLDYNIENALKIKILAKELNIIIIIIDDVFEYREGLDGIKPNLRDLYYDRLNEYSDIVIGLCNYSSYNIYVDENGRDLRELILVEILKGRKKEDLMSFYIPQNSLYKKNYEKTLLKNNSSEVNNCSIDEPF